MDSENEIYRLARERLVPMQGKIVTSKSLNQKAHRDTDEWRKHNNEYMRMWRKKNRERYNEQHRIYQREWKKRRAEKMKTEKQ